METTIALSNEIEIQKQELINWIATINDFSVLEDLIELKRRDTFNFEEEFKKGITGEELKRRTTEFLKTLPWKK
jgi:hypothetical protein